MSRIRVNSIKPISGTNVSVSGSLVVTGNVTAEEFITERVSTSIIYKSGSTKFGDTADDIHEMTGTLKLTGSAIITSNLELGAIANVETYVNVATASIATLDGHVGQIHLVTASHDTRITTAEGEIDQLQDSVTNLQINTGSQQTQINTNITNITNLQTDLNVATASIGVNETNIGTLTTDLTVATASIAANETNIGTLTTDLLVATASIAANETSIGALNAATSSFAFTTGSIFTGKQELTGSIDVSGSIEIKPTGDRLTNRLSFDSSEFHAKSPGFYWMTDSITIGSNDESTLFTQLNSTRLEVRTLLTLTPVNTKPTDLTVGTFAVSGSTPIYCDGVDWYPINLGTALP